MIQSEPYYWLTCDAPDCGVKSTEGCEYTAYGDVGGAVDSATASDWKVVDGRHYCDDHALNVCDECGTYDPTPFSGERDYLCSACWAKTDEGKAEVAS